MIEFVLVVWILLTGLKDDRRTFVYVDANWHVVSVARARCTCDGNEY